MLVGRRISIPQHPPPFYWPMFLPVSTSCWARLTRTPRLPPTPLGRTSTQLSVEVILAQIVGNFWLPPVAILEELFLVVQQLLVRLCRVLEIWPLNTNKTKITNCKIIESSCRVARVCLVHYGQGLRDNSFESFPIHFVNM